MTYFGRRNLQVDDKRCQRSLGQLRRVVDGVAVEDDQLHGARQFEDALDLGLHFGDAVGARIAALHQRPLGWIVEQ